MPVRSLNTSVLAWPDHETVDRAVRSWVTSLQSELPELVRLGYFGSYATGRWGVGSDLDLVAIVRDTDTPFERRGLAWGTEELLVPAEILVYTESEWKRLQEQDGRFARMLRQDTVWIFPSKVEQ